MRNPLDELRKALADRYAIERELGRGGMATVYLARDLKLDRPVAVKVLLEELGMALGPERFKREIAVATQLSHPHILPVYDSGEAAGQLYYVMPYVAGETLRDRLDKQRQLGIEEALRITCEVASALEHAHRHDVVHRDIKPENILLEDGQALVADFGIARAVSAVGEQKLTKTGVSLGTPAYMSPEQAMADPSLDSRTDIYSLGCVLYEMLAGTPPFTGPNAQSVIAKHALAEIPSLIVARQTIPDEVEDSVIRAMAKVPADRFATAAEFATALRACANTPKTGVNRTERRSRARPKPARFDASRIGALVAVIVLLLAGAGWVVWPILNKGSGQRSVGGDVDQANARRIAVLYFTDRSAGGQLGYLADGLTESLIDALESVQGLDVISRNGVAPFRGQAVSRDSLKAALNAGTLIDGFVERDSDTTRIRVTISLIEGNSGAEFDKAVITEPLGDPLALRQKITEQADTLLRRRLGADLRLRQLRAGTTAPDAWALVQQAEKLRKDADARDAAGDPPGAMQKLAAADTLLAGAATRDPAWAEPLVLSGHVAARKERLTQVPTEAMRWLDSAVAYASRALALDPRNADALELRGYANVRALSRRLITDQKRIDATTAAAEADLEAAVDANPQQAMSLYLLSRLMYQKLDIVESNLKARQAYEADAFLRASPEILYRLYVTSYDLEQFGPAEQWCDTGRRRFPNDANFARCKLWLMTTKAVRPDIAEAWSGVAELERLTPPQRREWARREGEMVTAVVIGKAGIRDSARAVLERAHASRDVDPTGELIGYEAFVLTQLGDHEAAIALLQRYLTDHPDHRRGFKKVNAWWWRDLQNDPRFKRLIAMQ